MRLAEDFKRKSRNLLVGLAGLFVLAFALDAWLGWGPLDSTHWHTIAGGILLTGAFLVASVSGRQLTRYGRGSDDLPRGTTDRMVTQGIFAYVRHPMFSSFIAILFGIGFLLNSKGFMFVSAPLGSLYIIWFAYFREEKEAETKFGVRYRRYKSCVPAFFPYKRPFRQENNEN